MLERFKNRKEAGRLLAQKLKKYEEKNVVVLALPRGGVPLAFEVASALHAPLDLVFAHKIGHPLQEEYAIAAISESGYLVGNSAELKQVQSKWLEEQKNHTLTVIKKRRHLYLPGRQPINLKNKIAIIVDDGIATGLTMLAAIEEIKHQQPEKIIVAIPMSPQSTADTLLQKADEVVALRMDPDFLFLGSVGSYYEDFFPVTDEEVIKLVQKPI